VPAEQFRHRIHGPLPSLTHELGIWWQITPGLSHAL
jgi:hypothetical protein